MKVREHYGIKGGYCMDCMTYALCLYLCAGVQEYKEAKSRR
jgi:Cys-rich protein (TIGR01571 family)